MAENGGNSRHILSRLDEWLAGINPAIIQINCGLHDLRRDHGAEANAVMEDDYEPNIRQIIQRLHAALPQTIIIWAQTTPVMDERHNVVKDFYRYNEQVIKYNQTAQRVMDELGIPVNNLYAVVEKAGREQIMQPDGVHFTPEGYQILGEAVACYLRPHLS